MKGLNIEDKDSLKEYLTQPLYSSKTSYCPFYKRSLISSQNTKFSRSNKTLTINIYSHLNNLNSSKLSESSPIKKNFSSKNNNKDKNIFKYNLNIFPELKEFNLYYEIPFHEKYDFIFLLRGNLEKKDWTLKTKNLRKYPKYLKNTLFYQNDIKLQQIHKYDFNKIYQIYNKIKKAGVNLYNNKKFKECLDQFNYAYGLFKWIEFKDKSIKLKDKINNDNFVIQDSDIEEKIVISDNNDNKIESFNKECLIYILEIMAYCNIELRLYSNAVECLDECVILTRNIFPDVYLRRAQARIFNKKSKDDELKLAEKDINKAINLVMHYNNKNKNNKNLIDINIYYKTKNKLNQINKKRLEKKVKYMKALLKPNLQLKNNNNEIGEENNDNIIYLKLTDNKRQYKILKEIKNKYILAFKFFTETKNYTQLNLTYKEYEEFYGIYDKFKFFYKFSPNSLNETILKYLTENEKKILFESNNNKIVEKNRMNICEYIFMNGHYNNELYKFAVDKIFEEEKNQNEKEEKDEKEDKTIGIKKEINSKKKKNFVIKSSICFIILILVSIGLQIYYLKCIRKTGYKSVYK